MSKPQHSTRNPKSKISPPPAAAPRPIPRWVVWAIDHGLWVTLAAAILTRSIHWASIHDYDPLYAQTLAMSDMQTYWQWAKEIAAGDWLGTTTRTGPFYYGPLYAYFLGVLFRIFGESYNAVHAVQALLGLVSPVVLWAICRRLFGKGPALATGLMAALCAPMLFYEQQLLVEGLLIAVNALLLLCLVRGQEPSGRAWLWAFGSGALSAISCWGRGNFLLVIPALAVAWLIMPTLVTEPPPEPEANRNSPCTIGNPKSKIQNPKRAGVRCAMAYVLGVVLLLGVTLWRNHHVAGQWVLTTSNGPILLYSGNASDSQGVLFYPPSVESLSKRYGSQGAVPWVRELLRDVGSHPLVFVGHLLKKAWIFWNSYDSADNVGYYACKRYSWLLRVSPVTWLTLVPLAVLGIWETRKRWRSQVFLYVYAVAFALSIIAVFIVGRYRLEEMLPMTVWAGPAVAVLAGYGWEARWKSLGARVLVLAAGIVLLWPRWSPAVVYNNPKGVKGMRLVRPNEYNRLAIAHLQLKQRREAQQILEIAVVEHPWTDGVVFPLATIYIEDKKPDKAVAIMQKYVGYKANDRNGILGLATALMLCGRRTEATYVVQGLLRNNPRDAEAQRLLLDIQSSR